MFISVAASATPKIVRVDGSIFDSSGNPLTASRDIRIKAYDAASGGTLLWTGATYDTTVSAGRFTINLNAASGSPSLVDRIGERTAGQAIYFQVEVDSGAADGNMDTPAIVLPRIRSKGTAFALSAATADGVAGVTATAAELNRLAGVTVSAQQLNSLSGVTANIQAQLQQMSSPVFNFIANGRLTFSSGTPVPTNDVTAATSVYYTPYNGNRIAVYDGSQWQMYVFTELSLSLSGYTANKNYDIYVYDNSGTLTLESTAWTNDSTRAVGLTMQDGVWVRSGGAGHVNRRFLGTIRTTGTTGQSESSTKLRLVSNVNNQILVSLQASDTTVGYTYTSTTAREANGSSTYGTSRVGYVTALPQVVSAWNSASGYINAAVGGAAGVGIGLDSASTPTGVSTGGYARNQWDGWSSQATLSEMTATGFHFVTRLEWVLSGGGTVHFNVLGTIPADGFGGMKVNIQY